MRHIFWLGLVLSFCVDCPSNLHATKPLEDLSNVCQANTVHFSGVTPEKCEKLAGYCYEAVDAANKDETARCRGLLFTIKREVESMMHAQVRLEEFIDDAFRQAEEQGANISLQYKRSLKRSFGIMPKGSLGVDNQILELFPDQNQEDSLLNCMRYKVYQEQPYYEPPPRLNAGLSLVILGSILTVVPHPIAIGAGRWAVGLGSAMMVESCVQGCERQQK